VENRGTAGKATDDYNMTHAHCMLDNEGYRHTLRIFNIYCFSTARLVARSRLHVAFMRILSVLK